MQENQKEEVIDDVEKFDELVQNQCDLFIDKVLSESNTDIEEVSDEIILALRNSFKVGFRSCADWMEYQLKEN